MIRYSVSIAVATALLTGCGAGESSSTANADQYWHLAPVESFRGGAGAPFQGDSIFYFRIRDALLLEDGGAVVATSGGENRLIFLDSLGGIDAIVGRTGQGPGEFQTMHVLFPADSGFVGLFDVRARRLTFASRSGIKREVSTINLAQSGRVLGLVSPTRLVSTAAQRFAVAEHLRDRPGLYAEHNHMIWRVEGDQLVQESPILSIPELPPASVTFSNDNGPRFTGHLGRSCLPEIRYGPTAQGLWVADPSSATLLRIDSTGSVVVEVQGSVTGILSEDGLAAFDRSIEELERDYGSYTRASKQAAREQLGIPGSPIRSAWSRIEADQTGRVWLERAVCYEEPDQREWDVFGIDGTKLGVAAIPSAYRVLAVRGDRVLVTDQGPFGVEVLKLLEVTR